MLWWRRPSRLVKWLLDYQSKSPKNPRYASFYGQFPYENSQRSISARFVDVCFHLCSYVYLFGMKVHRGWYRYGFGRTSQLYVLDPTNNRKRDVFTFVVGNYTWGGTGKTPFVIFLSKLLVSRGYQPVILSRGYGHQDEAKMLLQRQVASHVIITGSNREAAFHRLGSTNAPSTVAILDDGLQHWRLKRQCNILMVNAALAFGINGHLIPRGSLREPPEEAVARCTCIVLHHCSQVSDVQLGQLKSWFHKYCPEKPVLTSCMVAKSLYLVTCDGQKLPHACDTIANQDMVLCCGIEYPSGFLKTVVDYCRPRQVSIESLGDHHWFRLQDLWNIVHKWNSVYTHWNLLVTEKDYYRNEKVFHQLVNKDWTSNVRVFVVQADLQVHSGIHELEKLLDELGLGPT